MKKLILATAVASMFATGFAQASDFDFSANIGATSDYRYRGISQSRLEPALQGGLDLAHNPTGLYVGTWASSIKWVKDGGGGNKDIEMDFYGGKAGDLGNGISYDVGGLYYWYPDNDLSNSANTFELYGQLGYENAYVKYSHSLTDLFGFEDSKNSIYLEAGYDYDLGSGYTLGLHVGRQWIRDNADYNYTDYSIGVSKAFYGVDFSLAIVGTDADDDLYQTKFGDETGDATVILTATKTF